MKPIPGLNVLYDTMPVESHNIEHNGYAEHMPEWNTETQTFHPSPTVSRTANPKHSYLIRNHDSVLDMKQLSKHRATTVNVLKFEVLSSSELSQSKSECLI